jgi:molybdopterin converting factor small subunit
MRKMPKVNVIFQGIFKEITEKGEMIMEVKNGCTLRDLLLILAKTYGKDFNSIINPKTGEISDEVCVLLNGESMGKPDVILNDNDIVYIGILVTGG